MPSKEAIFALVMGVINGIGLVVHCIWEKQRVKRMYIYFKGIEKRMKDECD